MNLLRSVLAVSLLASPFAFAKDGRARNASSCSTLEPRALAEGPAAVGIYESDLGTGRRACPRTELGIAERGGAIIDTPNFYGSISADTLLFGSYAVSDRLEVFATLEAVKYQWQQQATLKGSELALGNATVGATFVGFKSGGLVLAPTARVLLPTSFATPGLRTLGAELGAAGAYGLGGRLVFHAYVGVDGTVGITAAESVPRGGASAIAGVEWAPLDWFGLVLDVHSHFGHRASDPTAAQLPAEDRPGAVDYIAPALGLRFAIGKSFGAELTGWVPVAGEARQLAAGALKLTWRL